MKLLILQNYDSKFGRIAELCCPTVFDYAAKHGYSYNCYRGTYSGLHCAWDKLFLAEIMLAHHDFVWTVDSDILILNPDMKIEEMMDPAFDVNICGDGAGENDWNVNTGSVVWKSTSWTKGFLKQVAEEGFSSQSTVTWEQYHIQSHLHRSEIASHFKRHHYTRFNCHGAFLRHFCGSQDIEQKLAEIRECLAGGL